MKYLLIFLSLIMSTYSYSQSAEEVLKSLQNKFDTITDLSADMVQKVNGANKFSGKIFFKKKNKIRFEFSDQMIITDGKTAWNYNKGAKKLIISNFEDKGMGFLSINYLVYKYADECNLSLTTENGKQVLILQPKGTKKLLGDVKLFLTKDYLLEKIELKESDVNLEFYLSGYKLNQNIADNKFSFTAPEGSNIVDLR